MKLSTKLAALLPLAILAATVATASPAQADAYYADDGYCFDLWNNTGWALQANFTHSIEDIYSRDDYFTGSPDQLAPGQRVNICTWKPRSQVTLEYSNSAESFSILMRGTTNTDGWDTRYIVLSNGIHRQVGRPDTLELRYTPATDAMGNYTWTNTSAFDFPTTFSLPSPQGSHQQSCSTLYSLHTVFAGIAFNTIQVRAWNDSSGAGAWAPQTTGAAHLRLTTDGNLQVVGDQTGQPLWSSNTAPSPGHAYPVTLKLQTDGNLAIYGANGQYMWDARIAPVCP
ncbi:MAG: hypothetical protein HOV83_16765 [Catenulispora sp.]|nr:hypothetical protein [Catenulispora sp.]